MIFEPGDEEVRQDFIEEISGYAEAFGNNLLRLAGVMNATGVHTLQQALDNIDFAEIDDEKARDTLRWLQWAILPVDHPKKSVYFNEHIADLSTIFVGMCVEEVIRTMTEEGNNE